MKKFLALVLTLAMVLTLNVGMIASAADSHVDTAGKTTVTEEAYILSGAQGYRMTRNLEEIENQIMRDYKRAKREMKRVTDRNSNLAYMQAMKLHGGEL